MSISDQTGALGRRDLITGTRVIESTIRANRAFHQSERMTTMIPNQWYAILDSAEVAHGRAIAATRLGVRIVVWRGMDGKIAVMRDACPHRGAALSEGRICEGAIQCPFHGFLFDPNGRCTQVPANGKSGIPPKALKVGTFPAQEKYGFIFAWWGEARDHYPPLPELDAIDDSFQYGTLRDRWAVHYSRAIENQLDVVHLPFVHADTIGRGRRTIVNGPIVRWGRDAAGQEVLDLWVQQCGRWNVASAGGSTA